MQEKACRQNKLNSQPGVHNLCKTCGQKQIVGACKINLLRLYCKLYEFYLQTQKKEEKTHPRFLKKEERFGRKEHVSQKKKEGKEAINGVVLMLPKTNRLTKSREIHGVLRKGQGIRRKSLLLKIETQPKSSPPRFAVVVGRKVSKKATVRNRIKRQIRAALRHELGGIKGVRCVVVALPGSAILSFKDICEIIKQALRP